MGISGKDNRLEQVKITVIRKASSRDLVSQRSGNFMAYKPFVG